MIGLHSSDPAIIIGLDLSAFSDWSPPHLVLLIRLLVCVLLLDLSKLRSLFASISFTVTHREMRHRVESMERSSHSRFA